MGVPFFLPRRRVAARAFSYRTRDDYGLPTYALGGIGPEDVKALLAGGAFGVAIRRAICATSQPHEALRRFLRELDG